MPLESRLSKVESKQRIQDDCFERMVSVIDGTHEVVSLVLKEQVETRKDIASLTTRFDQQDRRIEKIEELLIQIVNNLANK